MAQELHRSKVEGDMVVKEETVNFSETRNAGEDFSKKLHKMIFLLEEQSKSNPGNAILTEEIKTFKECRTSLEKIMKEKFDDKNIKMPLSVLAEEIRKNTFVAKLESFVTSYTKIAKEKLSKLGENKVLKAAWEVIASGCNLIKVTITSTIDKAVAVGKFAGAVASFGATMIPSKETGRER